MPFGVIAGVLGVAGAVLGAKGQRDAGKDAAEAQRYKAQVDNANAEFQQENNAALARYKTLLDNKYDYTSTLAANQQSLADAKGQTNLDFNRARITAALQGSEAKRSARDLTESTARGVGLSNRQAGRAADDLISSTGRSIAVNTLGADRSAEAVIGSTAREVGLSGRIAGRSAAGLTGSADRGAALGSRIADRSATGLTTSTAREVGLSGRIAGRSADELVSSTGRDVALGNRIAGRSAGELTETAQSRAQGTILGAGHTIDQLALEQAAFSSERRLELQNFTEEVKYNASVENAGQHHKARLLEFGADVARQEQVHVQQQTERQLLNDGRTAAAALAQNAVSGASRGVAIDEGTQQKIADDIAVLSKESQMDMLGKMDRELFGLEVDAIGAEKEAEFARFMGASALYKADLAVSHRSSETNLAISNRGQLTSQRQNAVREMANFEASEGIRLASMQAANIRANAADRGQVATANAASRAANIRADAADRGQVATANAADRARDIRADAADRGQAARDEAEARASQILADAADKGETAQAEAQARAAKIRADASDQNFLAREDAIDRATSLRTDAIDRGQVATEDAAARASSIVASASAKASANQQLIHANAVERMASNYRDTVHRNELTRLKAESRSSMTEFEIARAAEMQEFVAKGRTELASKGAAIAENTGTLNAIGTLIGAAGSVANQWHAYQVGA